MPQQSMIGMGPEYMKFILQWGKDDLISQKKICHFLKFFFIHMLLKNPLDD